MININLCSSLFWESYSLTSYIVKHNSKSWTSILLKLMKFLKNLVELEDSLEWVI
jgi:hypothetical protein